MRIAIGAILGVLGGPATYARELITALARVDSVNEYLVITDAPERLAVPAPNVRPLFAPLRTPFLQPAWDHGWVPYLLRRHHIDLYHGTKGMLPLWRCCPEVVTVHDLAVYHQPETFAWSQRLHQRSHTPFAVRRAVRVIADSDYSRQDLLQQFQLAPTHVVTVPLAAGPLFSAQPTLEDAQVAVRLNLPERYLLYAGTIQPRKNVERVVEAFVGLPDRDGVELLIAGRVRPGYRPAFLTHPPPQVRYLGPVSNQVLATLYRRALALCSPSSYEGFGLSLLEAMTSACVVIAGRNSAVPELVGDCGILVDETNVVLLRAALARVVNGEAALAGMRLRAQQRAAGYTWDETARRTLAVYQEAMRDARSCV